MALGLDRRFSHEHIRDYEDGELIFKEGDEGRELYIIQDGHVIIRKQTPIGELTMVEFTRGDFFGDMALLHAIPRYASAYAKGKCRLLILQPGGFLLKIRRDPTFAFEMIQQLSARVKFSSEKYIEALTSGKSAEETTMQVFLSSENIPQEKK